LADQIKMGKFSGSVAHMWKVMKGCGIFGSREEKRPFAKFNAWRWNTIKMDL